MIINHNILIKKRNPYGIEDSVPLVDKQFNGKKIIRENERMYCTSSSLGIYFGVPLGSVLGPELFLKYINVSSPKLLLFAHDIFHFGGDIKELLGVSFFKWFNHNNPSLNLSKPEMMLFGNRKRIIPSPMQVNGADLEFLKISFMM